MRGTPRPKSNTRLEHEDARREHDVLPASGEVDDALGEFDFDEFDTPRQPPLSTPTTGSRSRSAYRSGSGTPRSAKRMGRKFLLDMLLPHSFYSLFLCFQDTTQIMRVFKR